MLFVEYWIKNDLLNRLLIDILLIQPIMSLNILRELKFSDIIVAMFLRRSSAVSQYDLSQWPRAVSAARS